MLTYRLNTNMLNDDRVLIKYDYATLEDFIDTTNDEMMVTLYCDDVHGAEVGNVLNYVSQYANDNDVSDKVNYISETKDCTIYTVDKSLNTISFLDSKYTKLDIESITAVVEDGVATLEILFSESHGFNSNENPILYLNYINGKKVYINENLIYIDYCQLNWIYDPEVENAEDMFTTLFPDIDLTVDGTYEAIIGDLSITRDQIRWNINTQTNPTVYMVRYNVKLEIPFVLSGRSDLNMNGNINEQFVQHEKEKAVNNVIEMEKHVYTPVVVTNKGFINCSRINFNLHFREHSGADWTVENSDTWNFVKYGEYGGIGENNKYYSYGYNNDGSIIDKWNVSCQSDLLTYLGFVNNDVKYQKNVLKKSFIRLSFYDSPQSGSQNLLAYSTVFVDTNKLYSKFISRSNFECYFDSDGELVKGIRVDREVSESALRTFLAQSTLTNDEIEEYRLSSQLAVQNRYSTTNSSEGFYLYLWDDETISTVPIDLYMKVEYNHAGYGRNIPMMAPYKDNKGGFKTNEDIKNDWLSENTSYGIKKYLRYSYVHFKAKYDTQSRGYIYYLDPDTYGITHEGIDRKNIININLYEARVAFNN